MNVLAALGDSITRGHGEPALGVHCQSWALWLAEALGYAYLGLATDGALAADVRREQLPAVPPDGVTLACLHVGVNDARSVRWDPAAYERDVAAILDGLAERAGRVLVCTLPEDVGRPPAAPKPAAASAIVRRLAATRGAVCVELVDLAGPRLLLPDAVHPTAPGQLEIADRAARALGAPRLPSELVEEDRSAGGRVRYARRYAHLLAGDLRRRARERRELPA